MAKFKRGDRVRLIELDMYTRGTIPLGTTGTVDEDDQENPWVRWDKGPEDKRYAANESSLRLENEGGAPMARRTFRQLKDDIRARKGALWQEDCEDGTQPYSLITPEFSKARAGYRLSSCSDRSLVEDQPQWFTEVFAVEPQYMTREELDQWEAFKAKPATVRVWRAQISDSTPARKKRTWTEEQRAAHGAKIKAAHRRKKAAAKRAA